MNENVYKRPNKPLLCKELDFNIKNPMLTNSFNSEKPILLTVDKNTECHTTPDLVADYMVECLDHEEHMTIYEPHAGTGQLIAALLRENINIKLIKAGELNVNLCNFTRKRFPLLNIEQGDFINVSETFDRIICSPPFKAIIKHMNHVYKCLNTNGFAICLVPISYNKIEHEVLDILSADTFTTCNVKTKIIKISK